ncbi:hypothetical protein RJ640_010224 [Escallonia rubra]|uniref:Chlororespiratory reduction 4 n=1 Tax=Escallonia rubra TaxID=112253 RepID=A0AA88S8H8_9ASTE|nr:hypothetical protein RJ640_010224 [Escallonia rubra]
MNPSAAFVLRMRWSYCCHLSKLKLPASNRHSLHRIHHQYSPAVPTTIYNSNLKITSLGRHGKVEEARKLFDDMPSRDVVSYASMITVYLKHNDLPRAELLFRVMPQRNLVADSAMISGYAKAGRIDEAQRIFDGMPRRNVFSWTSLISGYFRSGRVCEARQLFERMPEKNVVSWTTALLGFAQNGLIDQARITFDQMPERNVVAWTAMIKVYVDNYLVNEAYKLFCQMPERNLYSWNIMIQGCLDGNKVDEAVRLFASMPRRNAVSWTTMVTGLARNRSTKLAREYFDQMPNKDIAAWNAMITAYADEGLMVEATGLFDMMSDRNTVTWNAIIDGYSRNGPEGEAFKYLIEMLRCCIRANETTLTSVLASSEGNLELMQVHTLVVRLGFEHETSLTNALVTMYSKGGDVNSARLAFDKLEVKDTVSWTAIILAYSNHGHGKHALQAFARMIRSGTKPDEITFVGVLSACSHAGLVRKGQRLFNSMMHVYGLEPSAEHYSCLVDILGRAGQVNDAVMVVSQMPAIERDGVVLGALLGACKLHGDVGMANQIGEELIKLEPTNSGGYILLANIYAACGKWKELAQVRKKMKERKVNKIPGFSRIEFNGRSHVFLVGDRSHPEVKEIHMMLTEKLLPLMQEMDYTLDNSSVLLQSEI